LLSHGGAFPYLLSHASRLDCPGQVHAKAECLSQWYLEPSNIFNDVFRPHAYPYFVVIHSQIIRNVGSFHYPHITSGNVIKTGTMRSFEDHALE
jgi:hypothetical protein